MIPPSILEACSSTTDSAVGISPVCAFQNDGYVSLSIVWRMSRLTRDGTAGPVSREFSGANGDREISIFDGSADHKQNWQPYPVDPYSAYKL